MQNSNPGFISVSSQDHNVLHVLTRKFLFIFFKFRCVHQRAPWNNKPNKRSCRLLILDHCCIKLLYICTSFSLPTFPSSEQWVGDFFFFLSSLLVITFLKSSCCQSSHFRSSRLKPTSPVKSLPESFHFSYFKGRNSTLNLLKHICLRGGSGGSVVLIFVLVLIDSFL